MTESPLVHRLEYGDGVAFSFVRTALGERAFEEPVPAWLGLLEDGEPVDSSGDIVVPGLLLAFAMRFDESGEPGRRGARRNLYFAWPLGAYALGLGLTCLANAAISSPQPAPVYLSPATVGVVALLGAARGELPRLLAFEVPEE